SQIPYASRNMALTRLAQQVEQVIEGREPVRLTPRMYYDENPPSKAHWTYRLFVQKIDPETKLTLPNADDYAHFYMNPHDNRENISDDYLQMLEGMSARMRLRFLEGKFGEAISGALFLDEHIEAWRHNGSDPLPEMVRVVVSVDPSGSDDEDNADNDEIGIVV